MSYSLAAITVFNLLCAGISAWVAFQALTQYYRINNRVESVEDKLESALGKMHREKGITRDTIRDAVDTYLGTLDLQTSGGGMDSEIMQMMMAQMMGGAMGGQAQSEPAGAESRESNSTNNLLGSGGDNG